MRIWNEHDGTQVACMGESARARTRSKEQYLREEAKQFHCMILDATCMPLEMSAQQIWEQLHH
jgi:hypothetical protein